MTFAGKLLLQPSQCYGNQFDLFNSIFLVAVCLNGMSGRSGDRFIRISRRE